MCPFGLALALASHPVPAAVPGDNLNSLKYLCSILHFDDNNNYILVAKFEDLSKNSRLSSYIFDS